MLSGLIHGVVGFLVQALTLKLAVGIVSDTRDNTYATAIGISALLAVLGVMFDFIPILGWIAYMVVWVVVVASTYRIGTLRSIGVAIAQVIVHMLISLGLGLIGWKT
jgi:hypothetical protein